MIGVLTKSDLVQAGEYEPWLKILRNGKPHCLALGYYATRQLSTDDREKGTISLDKARENERIFFETHPVWKRMNPEFLGTTKLKLALSNQLASMIKKTYFSLQIPLIQAP